jgi:hypothetical protein
MLAVRRCLTAAYRRVVTHAASYPQGPRRAGEVLEYHRSDSGRFGGMLLMHGQYNCVALRYMPSRHASCARVIDCGLRVSRDSACAVPFRDLVRVAEVFDVQWGEYGRPAACCLPLSLSKTRCPWFVSGVHIAFALGGVHACNGVHCHLSWSMSLSRAR